MEILNNGIVTPQRVYALLRLVAQQEAVDAATLQSLIQPNDTADSHVRPIISTCKHYDWLQEDPDGQLWLGSKVSVKSLETLDSFRQLLRSRLVGFRTPDEDDYRLNMLLAWYAANDERVFSFDNSDSLVQAFEADVLADNLDVDGRAFNPTKYNSWKRWATFMEFGWNMNGDYIPDSSSRLQSVLPQVLQDGELVGIREFVQQLGRVCTELDNGELYLICRHQKNAPKRNTLSMVLSQGLRTLHDENIIALRYIADADYIETLYPCQNHPIQQISHITYNGGAA